MFLRGVLAGVFLTLVGIAAVGLLAKSFSCEQPWFGVNTVSKHASGVHNERNLGLFYECPGTWGYQAGFYRNSFYRDTAYVVGTYQPLHLGPVDIGVFGGPATGYNHSVVFIGGLVLTLHFADRVALQVIANHAVAGLQLKMRF